MSYSELCLRNEVELQTYTSEHPVQAQAFKSVEDLRLKGMLSDERAEAIQGLISWYFDPLSETWINTAFPFDNQPSEAVDLSLSTQNEFEAVLKTIRENQDIHASELATQQLFRGEISTVNAVLAKYGKGVEEMSPELKIAVIDQPEEWWFDNLGTTGIALNSTKRGIKLLALNPQLDHIDHEIQHVLYNPPQFKQGKGYVIGHFMEHFLIDYLDNKMVAERSLYNLVMTNILESSKVERPEFEKIAVEAITGKPEKLFSLITNIHDEEALAMLLLVDPAGGNFPGLITPDEFSSYFYDSHFSHSIIPKSCDITVKPHKKHASIMHDRSAH